MGAFLIAQCVLNAQQRLLQDQDPITVCEGFVAELMTAMRCQYGFLAVEQYDTLSGCADASMQLSILTPGLLPWDESIKSFYQVTEVSRDEWLLGHDGYWLDCNNQELEGTIRVCDHGDALIEHLPDQHPPIHNYLKVPIPIAQSELGVRGLLVLVNGQNIDSNLQVEALMGLGENLSLLLERRLQHNRTQVEQRRVQEESHFRSIVETTHEGIWIIDQQFKTVFVNRRMADILDQPYAVVQKTSIMEYLNGFQSMDLFLPESCDSFEHEVTFIRPSGDEIPCRVMRSQIPGDTEETCSTLLMITDISQQKAFEHYDRALFDHCLDMLCIMNFQGFFVRINPAFESVLGYSQHELMSESFLSRLHPEDVDKTREVMRRLGFGQDIIDFENRYIAKDGSIRYLRWRATADVQNQLMFATARDVTLQKQLELDLELINFSVETTRTPMVWLNDQGQPVRINKAACQLFQISPSEWMSHLVDHCGHGLFEGISWPQWMDVLIHEGSVTKRSAIKTKSGTYTPVETVAHYLEFGGRAYVTVSYRDLTEQLQYESKLIEAKQLAEEANMAKSTFLANMSHEIRTPINGIVGMTDLLLASDLSDEQQDMASTIKTSSESLLGVINDILDLSKIEAGKLSIETIPFNLRKLIEETGRLLVFQAEKRGLRLMVRYAPQLPDWVISDPGRIRQMLINFASNAIKFTAKGYVYINVEPVTFRDGEVVVRFSVEDTGIGIKPDMQEKVFQKFTQEDLSTTRKYGGTGLGLAIVKQLTELLGGQVGVHSEVGHGSIFWTILPLKLDNPKMKPFHSVTAGFEGKRVLIVDNFPLGLQKKSELLGFWGIKTESCRTIQQAMTVIDEMAKEGIPFDLLWLDQGSVKEPIAALMKAINQKSAQPIKCLVSLPASQPELIQTHLDQGACGCLTNPMSQTSLIEGLFQAWGRPGIKLVEAPQASQQPPNEAEFWNTHNKQILLVEDNVINQKLILKMLAKLNQTVIVANNGLEAVEKVKTGNFDLILMDCQMPEMDGYEATQQIRQYQSRSQMNPTPIVALTANALKGDRERCLEVGMDDYLSKPIDLAELKAVMAKWMSAQSSSEEDPLKEVHLDSVSE